MDRKNLLNSDVESKVAEMPNSGLFKDTVESARVIELKKKLGISDIQEQIVPEYGRYKQLLSDYLNKKLENPRDIAQLAACLIAIKEVYPAGKLGIPIDFDIRRGNIPPEKVCKYETILTSFFEKYPKFVLPD